MEATQLDVPVLISMPIPKGLKAEGLLVCHMGTDQVPELIDTSITGNQISLVTDSFSNYVFAQNTDSSDSGGNEGGSISRRGSSSGSFSTSSYKSSLIPPAPGQWKQTEAGKWQFLNADETGAMRTGWVTVDNKQYYFGTDGIMLANGVTPDGYTVDETGARV